MIDENSQNIHMEYFQNAVPKNLKNVGTKPHTNINWAILYIGGFVKTKAGTSVAHFGGPVTPARASQLHVFWEPCF